MIESAIEDWVCDRAEAAGWLVRKLQWVGRRNAPDRLFAKDGRVLFIEFKRPGEQARPTQAREVIRMQAAGMEVHVLDSPLLALHILGIPFDCSPP